MHDEQVVGRSVGLVEKAKSEKLICIEVGPKLSFIFIYSLQKLLPRTFQWMVGARRESGNMVTFNIFVANYDCLDEGGREEKTLH